MPKADPIHGFGDEVLHSNLPTRFDQFFVKPPLVFCAAVATGQFLTEAGLLDADD
jgi:hypothetical protein